MVRRFRFPSPAHGVELVVNLDPRSDVGKIVNLCRSPWSSRDATTGISIPVWQNVAVTVERVRMESVRSLRIETHPILDVRVAPFGPRDRRILAVYVVRADGSRKEAIVGVIVP